MKPGIKRLTGAFTAVALLVSTTGCSLLTDYDTQNIEYYGKGGLSEFNTRLEQVKLNTGMAADEVFRILQIDRAKFDVLDLEQSAWEHRGINLKNLHKDEADTLLKELDGVTVLRMKFRDVEKRFSTNIIRVTEERVGYESKVVIVLKDDHLLQVRESRENINETSRDSTLDDAAKQLVPFAIGAGVVGGAALATGGALRLGKP